MKVMKDIIQQKIYDRIDFYIERDMTAGRQSLWHAANLEKTATILDNGYLEAHTSHRYWPDGIRRKEDDPLYENSCWMYGWSMTRKREYAQGWNGVLFEFDSQKIAETFEIQPLAWNNLFKHNKKFVKKEFEDFVIAHYEPRSIQDMKDFAEKRNEEIDNLYDKMYDSTTHDLERQKLKEKIDKLQEGAKSWVEDWKTPRGKKLSVEKCVKGIYINEYHFELYSKDHPESEGYKNLCTIINHPLFKGLYKDPHKTEVKNIKPAV